MTQGTSLDFPTLMRYLYGERRQIAGLSFHFSKQAGERVILDLKLADSTERFVVTEARGIEHLLRFKKAHAPAGGPVMTKVQDLNAHWANWEQVTKISQQERDEARRKLLKGEEKIDFPWSELLHDALGTGRDAFSARFAPLREHHTLLLAHLELLGIKHVERLEKAEANPLYKEAVRLVKDSWGFVESPKGFLPRVLDMPGGPAVVEAHVAGHMQNANRIIDTISRMEKPDRNLNLYTVLALYSTLIEALRIPLRILAKCINRTFPHNQGNTDGSLTELVEYLTSHPKVGTRYARFLDADLRHSFSHAHFRFSQTGVDLTDQDNAGRVRRTITVDDLFAKLKTLLGKFMPAALSGALVAYYLDCRLMMTTVPYAEWLVGVGNTKR